ncbi:MAG: hypothetical protein IKG93_10880 [Clostridiales bacterium]|nr:hypothetical protein [Clostridiales bacterium]
MDWENFYKQYDDMEQAELVREFLNLSNFGPAADVAEVLDEVLDKQDQSILLSKALEADAFRTAQDLETLDGVVSEEMIDEAALKLATKTPMDFDSLEILADIVSAETFAKLVTWSLDEGEAFTTDEICTLDNSLRDHDVLLRLISEVKAPVTIDDIDDLSFLLDKNEDIEDVLSERGDLYGVILDWEKENNLDGDFDDSDDIDEDW